MKVSQNEVTAAGLDHIRPVILGNHRYSPANAGNSVPPMST